MATVSEIKWDKETDGKCPYCGRVRALGHINTVDDFQWPARCIDCCFGPPMEYWDMCDDCGQLFVGEHCDNPQCVTGRGKRRSMMQNQSPESEQPKSASAMKNCETCNFNGKCPHSLTCGLKFNMWRPKEATSTVLTKYGVKFLPDVFQTYDSKVEAIKQLLQKQDARTRHEIARRLEEINEKEIAAPNWIPYQKIKILIAELKK